MKSLQEKAKEYARYQLNKRATKQARGEKVGGITGMIARAFFHGYLVKCQELETNDNIEQHLNIRGDED